MHDPNRIDPILDQLRDVWNHQPDLRLGQLMVVLAGPQDRHPDLFDLPDHYLIRRLAAYRDAIEQGNLQQRYVKQRWDDSRGDEYDDWGPSWWYFEIDALGYVLRQLEDYDDGPTNGYDTEYEEDRFGGLTDQPLDNVLRDYEQIPEETFNTLWHARTNCR